MHTHAHQAHELINLVDWERMGNLESSADDGCKACCCKSQAEATRLTSFLNLACLAL